MSAELLPQRVLRKRMFSTSFLWQTDEKTNISISFLFNRKKGKIKRQSKLRVLFRNIAFLSDIISVIINN